LAGHTKEAISTGFELVTGRIFTFPDPGHSTIEITITMYNYNYETITTHDAYRRWRSIPMTTATATG
jgi:hypothetical protein